MQDISGEQASQIIHLNNSIALIGTITGSLSFTGMLHRTKMHVPVLYLQASDDQIRTRLP